MRERVVLHSDLNSFYASVECLYDPSIRDKPVSVCGSVDDRHGIVLASNPIAKRFGVQTGDAVWQAKQKCRELVAVRPHMERYVKFSKAAREIYSEFSPCVMPYGLDENWLDLTGTEGLFGSGAKAANAIRERVKRELGVTVSIGVSFNKSFSKLASDYKKPDAVTTITKSNYRELVWPLPVSDLLFCGRATTKKLVDIGINTIGQLAKCQTDILKRRLGVNGLLLWRYANGIDDDPVTNTGVSPTVKSVGNSTTTPRDLKTPEEIRVTTMLLAESVAERLRGHRLKCQTVQISLRYANLAWFERQTKLEFPCCTAQRIGDTATMLIQKHWTGEPLRSLGVRGCDLIGDDFPQLSMLPEMLAEQKREDLETAVQDVRRRFGHFSVQRGIMVADKRLSNLDTQAEHSPQSVAFFRG
jgi:DNA polymerase-4